jgi:hypothetical protein
VDHAIAFPYRRTPPPLAIKLSRHPLQSCRHSMLISPQAKPCHRVKEHRWSTVKLP